jgi:hypothetical protein
VWVTFDPTPAAGRNLSQQDMAANPIAAQFNKYAEAMQMFWLQYVVGYDRQEQNSLVRNFRGSLMQNQERAASFWTAVRESVEAWWREVRGQNGAANSAWAIGKTILWTVLIAALMVGGWILFRRLRGSQFWQKFNSRSENEQRRVVEFYERMNRALSKRGLTRQPAQTPLEFAAALAMPEVGRITEAYNRVRFGEQMLNRGETSEIEDWLNKLERIDN